MQFWTIDSQGAILLRPSSGDELGAREIDATSSPGAASPDSASG